MATMCMTNEEVTSFNNAISADHKAKTKAKAKAKLLEAQEICPNN